MKKMAVLLRVKSTLLGVFFTASPFASIFAVDALRYSFNFMDSAGMFYGLLLLLQVIIGYIGAKVNQATKVVKAKRICSSSCDFGEHFTSINRKAYFNREWFFESMLGSI